jgi:iron complex outermembrane receptor protein
VSKAQQPSDELTSQSLEDLMNIEVTSVSKKEEKLFQTAAAVYVITQEDIRRSGLTSLPEILRLVPGLEVARIDGNKWAISARGFNGRFANKMLVLIDGRNVYSPQFAGVYWEVQDLLLEDIERIEVIRGPGGSLWGTNAVNGVINIITKHTKNTQGGLVTAGGGSEDRDFGGVRYGGKIGENTHYRVYAKYFNRSALVNASGGDANDGQNALRGGGRMDWQATDRDALTLQGDIYNSSLRETPLGVSPAAPFAPNVNAPGQFSGGNVLGRWNRVFSKRSDLALQIYYDRARHDTISIDGRTDTFDLDFQHRFPIGRRQDLIWGLGYRLLASQSNSSSATTVQFNPKTVHDLLYSAFVQDELTLLKDRLRLTLGTKLEHNSDSGLEIQPSVRLVWTPNQHQAVWGAFSRVVRPPTIASQDIRINVAAFRGAGGVTNILALLGSTDNRSERLRAYELGYRVQATGRLSLDVTSFYNLYDRLTTLEPGRPFFETNPLPSHLVIPLVFSNLMSGETYGAEAAVNYSVTHQWKLSGSYSFLRMQLHPSATSADKSAETPEADNPRHQFQLHSYLNLPRSFELDTSLYYVSATAVPGYTRLDARLGWRVKEQVELSMGLQNLLAPRRAEFDSNEVVTSQVKRSVYGKLTWRFSWIQLCQLKFAPVSGCIRECAIQDHSSLEWLARF